MWYNRHIAAEFCTFFLGTLKATQELQEKKYNHGNAISRQVKVLTGTGLKHQVLFF